MKAAFLLENFQNHNKSWKQKDLPIIVMWIEDFFGHDSLQFSEKARKLVIFAFCLAEAKNQSFDPEDAFKKRKFIKKLQQLGKFVLLASLSMHG